MICDHCAETIYVTAADPLCHTSRGRFHYRCLHAGHTEHVTRRRARSQEEELPDFDPECFNEKVGPPGQENTEEE
jgi:hypothetical protein